MLAPATAGSPGPASPAVSPPTAPEIATASIPAPVGPEASAAPAPPPPPVWTPEPTIVVPPTPTPPAPALAPPTPPAPAPSRVSYPDCDAVRAAGAAPLYKGEPGYSTKLDRDRDGVACE
ncbi:excalibur calcium-binding domain-containing protein [Nocardia sp. NPDC001965]